MPGLAKVFDNVIDKELQMKAAWFPITNDLKVGDFGLIEDGIFRPMGNIQNRYPDIKLDIQPGKESKVDFTSEGTSVLKFDADGEAVAALEALGNLKASLKFKFSQTNSCVIKAILTSQELKNIADVTDELYKKATWKRNYKVVSKTFIGQEAVVICTREAGAEYEISGSADILSEIEKGGKVKAGVSGNFSRKSGLGIVGETGVLAIELFKVGNRFFDDKNSGATYEIITGASENDL